MARTMDMGMRTRFMALAKSKNLSATVTRPQLVKFCEDNDIQIPQWLTADKTLVVARGVYRIPYDRFAKVDPTKEESSTKFATPSLVIRPTHMSARIDTGESFNARFERALKAASR